MRIFQKSQFDILLLIKHSSQVTSLLIRVFCRLKTQFQMFAYGDWVAGEQRKYIFSYKNREDLFTQQRRKIDLKTFSNWEDSPEKMMMDMMSNPNAVRREEC